MTLFKYRGYDGTAEVDVEDEVCFGKILFIDDLITYEADSVKELRAAFEHAVDDYLKTCVELGRKAKKPLSGQFNVRVTPVLHKEASVKALSEGITLNALVGKAIEHYVSTGAHLESHVKAIASTVVASLSIGRESFDSRSGASAHKSKEWLKENVIAIGNGYDNWEFRVGEERSYLEH